ncbi:MAG: GTP-binding protein [Candidatus Thorarchaeota archaeon]
MQFFAGALITIKSANISLLHEYKGNRYVVNLVDTPGHVDFSGKVTRAMRMIDGAIVVIDAVEGVMAQTESVIRSALKEAVKPVLFINKIDRLIRELKLSPTQIEKRLNKIIQDVNTLISSLTDSENHLNWTIMANTVAFGSALHKWAFTINQMQKANLQFQDIIQSYQNNQIDPLSAALPIHQPILNMILENLPSPPKAQKYRIRHIWKGDPSSPAGRTLHDCDPEGPLIIGISKLDTKSKHGLVAVGRIFSGTLRKGSQIRLFPDDRLYRTQRVTLFMGPRQVVVPSLTAGNICGLIGVEDAQSGVTITGQQPPKGMEAFEDIQYASEPVVTISIEPKSPKELPRLLNALETISKGDPNLHFTINEQTGENLLSGLGLLHLEITLKDITETGVQVIASEPIVLYRETPTSGITFTEKYPSPNTKNSIKISIIPDPGEIKEEEIWYRDNRGNILANATNFSFSESTKDALITGFQWAMEKGPLCSEPIGLTSIRIVDIEISTVLAEQNKVELMSMIREAITEGFKKTGMTLLEPIYAIQLIVPHEYLKETTGVIISKRGQVDHAEHTGLLATISGLIPVSESFDLADIIRSKTSGKAIWQTTFSRWQPVPTQRVKSIISIILKRKGLS